jgi:glucosylceramidase
MSLSPDQEAQLVLDLHRAFQAAKLPTQIYGGEAAWGAAPYSDTLVTGPARGTLGGVSWHCYHGTPDSMTQLHSTAPAVAEVVSECANRLTAYPVPEVLIGATRNWASAVALWNLALDPQGGPVQPPDSGCRPCRGMITVNESTNTATPSLAYYQLGQFGRFVESGAQRIGSNHFVTYYSHGQRAYGVTPGLDDVTFKNPDGTDVLVAYNNAAKATRFSVEWEKRLFTYTIAPQAMVTFRWRAP